MDVGKLEQAIRENPASPEAYLVYGDWLESQGDPRGELIAVQITLATEPTDALLARELELLVLHERSWLGDALSKERGADRLICEWRFGFLRAVTMYAPSPELFAALRDCPVAKFLEVLAIDTRANPNRAVVPHPREIGPLCRIEVVETPSLPQMSAPLRLEAEAAMAAVQTEALEREAWESEFRVNPYNPWHVANERLARAELVPYLVQQLGVEGGPSDWARHALAELGPVAAAATDALREYQSWYELWRVAPDHAKSLGIHRRPPMRDHIANRLFREDPRAFARHLAPMLMSESLEIVHWALDSNGYSDRSHLERLTRDRPRCVPRALLRALLNHADERVRDHAASRLVEMRFPEDADLVIDAILGGRAKPRARYATWLGSHPKSDGLLARVTDEGERFHLLRRRRCAGLATEIEPLTFPNEHKLLTLARGDQWFLEGKLDDASRIESSALSAYAHALIDDPTCAAAAFRIAWIERGFGALVSEQRITWLRSLGASERALAMLARRPPEIVPGMGYGSSMFEPHPIRAAAALAAGLPSLAYWYFPKDSPEGAAAREAAKLQLPTLC